MSRSIQWSQLRKVGEGDDVVDGYVLPGHDHVFEQQAHDLAARVKVGLGGVEPGGHLRAERLDRGQRWGQLRARLPLLLQLCRLRRKHQCPEIQEIWLQPIIYPESYWPAWRNASAGSRPG